jgi:hypothetical protein
VRNYYNSNHTSIITHALTWTGWNDLKGDLQDCINSWSRKLLTNPTEIQLRETLRNLDYRTFMDTLFDARSGTYSNLRKDDWICLNCLSALWRHALSIWWLEQKREGKGSVYSSVETQVIDNL